jgi:hypothetical protein
MVARSQTLPPYALALLVATACGSGKGPGFAPTADGGDTRDGTTSPSGASDGATGDDSGFASFGDGGLANGPLAISPADSSISVPYGQHSPTVGFKTTRGGQTVAATYAVDRPEVGSVDASGVFTPTGLVGGTVAVTASFGNVKVTTHVMVSVHYLQNGAAAGAAASDGGVGAGGNGGVGGEGPGAPVDSTTLAALMGQPTTDAGLSWLYPYDKTVWPRGLLAPLLQWAAPRNYDGIYIHLKETAFEYAGFFKNTATPFVHHPVPQAAWDALSQSNAGESVSVSIVLEAGATAYGPLTETWKIASGTLRGTVYYDSYGTNLAHNFCCTINGQNFGGATLAIKHGATAPVLVAGNDSECRVCHSVSADGSRLITQGENNAISSAYDLKNGYTETVMSPADSRFAWAGLYPNGRMLLTDSAPWANNVGLQGAGWNGDAQLFSIPGGTSVASTGIPAGLHAGAPAFSPDGKHVAFNLVAGPNADGKSLAMMDYDPTTSTFSNLHILFTPPSGMVVWPTFLPTDSAIVFELETVNNGRDWGGTRASCDTTGTACSSPGAQGHLMWLDVATKTATTLAVLDGAGYLPSASATGHTGDSDLNYEPTVSPVPSGGYAWVVFTSRRLYGNVANINPYWSDPRYHDISSTPTTKKLWAAAIDLNATPGTDPSHPAFYLPGQELLAGNSRGFWVFDACHADGTSCNAGDECCGGYCSVADGGTSTCNTLPPLCSSQLDKCTQTSQCCSASAGIACIGGVCTQPTPQ